MRRLTVAAAFGALIASVWLVGHYGLSGAPAGQPGGGVTPLAPSSGEGGDSAQASARAERVEAVRRLEVVNARDERPVPGAMLVDATAEPFLRLSDNSDVPRTNADGTVALPSGKFDLVVVAAGFVPQSLDARTIHDSARVLLVPSAEILVRVVDETSNPVPNVTVALQSVSSIRPRPPRRVGGGSMVGNPSHADPLWLTTTDEMGTARFRELPAKRFMLQVASDRYVARSSVATSREPVTAPADIHIVMEMAWALVVKRPEGPPIATWDWLFSATDVETSARVSSQIEWVRTQLEAAHPDCLLFVGRPHVTDQPTEISCRVVTEDGAVWQVRWSLQPVDRAAPVFLELQANRVAKRIRFHVVDRDGKPLATPLAVYAKDDDRHHLVRDDGLLLIDGNYKLMAWPMSPWLHAAFADAAFRVAPDSPPNDTVTVRVEESFGRLTVEVKPEVPPIEATYVLSLIDANGKNINMPNLLDGEPREFLVPKGKVRVRVFGHRYETAEQVVEMREQERVTVPLRRKPK